MKTLLGIGAVVCLVIMLIVAVGTATGPKPIPKSIEQIRSEAAQKSSDEERWKVMLGAALTLRKSMRNPDSLVIEQALQMDDGAACFTYRAQNGFGGMNRERAVLSPKANRFLSSSQSGFSTLWRNECARSGTDKADLLTTAFGMLDSE